MSWGLVAGSRKGHDIRYLAARTNDEHKMITDLAGSTSQCTHYITLSTRAYDLDAFLSHGYG